MGVIIASREEVQEYFDSPRLNQSTGKALFNGLESFLQARARQQDDGEQDYYSEKGHFVKGSAVDMKLTGNDGDYEAYHHISTIEKKPTDVLMAVSHKFVDMLRGNAEEMEQSLSAYVADNGGDVGDYELDIVRICRDIGYQANWKDETLVKNVVPAIDEYVKDLIEADGKQVLSQEEAFLADDIVMSLTTNENTKTYFDRESFAKDPNLDVYYQKIIYFEYKGIECKAMIDIVIVRKDDEGNPINVLAVDIKTMSGYTLDFDKSLKIRRYDVQAAWYTLALITEYGDIQDPNKGPVIEPFRFVVESTTHVGNPLVYQCDNSLIIMGAVGRPNLMVGGKDGGRTPFVVSRDLKGYEHFIEDYLWYEENGWEMDRKMSLMDSGVLKLDWNGIMANDGNKAEPVLHKQDVEVS